MQEEYRRLKAKVKETIVYITSKYETKVEKGILKDILSKMIKDLIHDESELEKETEKESLAYAWSVCAPEEYWTALPDSINEMIVSCYIKYKTKVEVRILQSILSEMKTKILGLLPPVDDRCSSYCYETESESDSEESYNYYYESIVELISNAQILKDTKDDDADVNVDDIPSAIKQTLGPPWMRGEIEKPAGKKDHNSWTSLVYTEEQQERLGVDENGKKVGHADWECK